MYPTHFLQWWHNGTWENVGWPASTPDSVEDLRKHAEALATDGGWYQLVVASAYAGGPPSVVQLWGAW